MSINQPHFPAVRPLAKSEAGSRQRSVSRGSVDSARVKRELKDFLDSHLPDSFFIQRRKPGLEEQEYANFRADAKLVRSIESYAPGPLKKTWLRYIGRSSMPHNSSRAWGFRSLLKHTSDKEPSKKKAIDAVDNLDLQRFVPRVYSTTVSPASSPRVSTVDLTSPGTIIQSSQEGLATPTPSSRASVSPPMPAQTHPLQPIDNSNSLSLPLPSVSTTPVNPRAAAWTLRPAERDGSTITVNTASLLQPVSHQAVPLPNSTRTIVPAIPSTSNASLSRTGQVRHNAPTPVTFNQYYGPKGDPSRDVLKSVIQGLDKAPGTNFQNHELDVVLQQNGYNTFRTAELMRKLGNSDPEINKVQGKNQTYQYNPRH